MPSFARDPRCDLERRTAVARRIRGRSVVEPARRLDRARRGVRCRAPPSPRPVPAGPVHEAPSFAILAVAAAGAAAALLVSRKGPERRRARGDAPRRRGVRARPRARRHPSHPRPRSPLGDLGVRALDRGGMLVSALDPVSRGGDAALPVLRPAQFPSRPARDPGGTGAGRSAQAGALSGTRPLRAVLSRGGAPPRSGPARGAARRDRRGLRAVEARGVRLSRRARRGERVPLPPPRRRGHAADRPRASLPDRGDPLAVGRRPDPDPPPVAVHRGGVARAGARRPGGVGGARRRLAGQGGSGRWPRRFWPPCCSPPGGGCRPPPRGATRVSASEARPAATFATRSTVSPPRLRSRDGCGTATVSRFPSRTARGRERERIRCRSTAARSC